MADIVGQNFTADVESQGDELVIRVNLAGPATPSKSGKSQVIASTRGNKRIVIGEGSDTMTVYLGLNVYRLA